ncbi:hypothetical protein Zmor_010441 [Zophobas morio]|uniref:Uncharacterized protein n=1 Tax=Zophobas morio TaxID=2755281 RepID=A0AA38MJP5_9CUCU|nr:hypothetical protein Zmor_010441 [Zophobas morio]
MLNRRLALGTTVKRRYSICVVPWADKPIPIKMKLGSTLCSPLPSDKRAQFIYPHQQFITPTMESNPCCKGDTGDCVRNADGTCTFTKKCILRTSEGEFQCECVCTCECGDSCKNCTCDCNCTPETAQKIQTENGVKYKCECKCKC